MSLHRSVVSEPSHHHHRPRSRSSYTGGGGGGLSGMGGSRTMSANVRHLQEALNVALPDHDRAYFVHALSEYNSRRNVYTLVANLKSILDTPEKRQLYLLLGKVVPASDQALFWQHAEPLYKERDRRPESAGRRTNTSNHGDQRHYFDTMPTRTRPPDLSKNDEPHGKTHRKTSGSSWEADANTNTRRVVLKKSDAPDGELGFSIRGGSEHSVGIFVSMVEPNTMAEKKGLQPGDQLIQVNEIPLEKITHGEAVKVLKSAKKLVLYVKSVGRVPGSFVSHQTYTWVDPKGRSVSPPPDVDLMGRRLSESVGRRSGLNLLKDGDEKKVNLVVSDGHSLGLMIRGGREFSLGIYITGVDAYSVAEYASLKVGDQILDVNGENFLDIKHQEAVNILKSSKLMMMTIKDVGKLPYARTTIDRTQWITGDGVSDLTGQVSRPTSVVNGWGGPVNNGTMVNGEQIKKSSSSSNFSRGIAGTQVMYNSALGTGTQAWGMIEDQARHLLNENERGTMMYYLSEYQNGTINIEALVMALFELLNTHAKFSLFSEIRSFVFPRDIDQFDSLVLKREVESMKARQRGHFMNERENSFGDTFSNSSHYSSSSIDSRPITPPHVPVKLPPYVKMTSDPDEWHNGFDLRQINDDTNGLPDYSLPDFAIDSTPPSLIRPSSGHKSSRITPSKTVQQSNQQTITVDVHHDQPTTSRGVGKGGPEGIYVGSVKSPSEDSGVDVQLNGSRVSSRNGDRFKKSVTISSIPPVTIHSPGSVSDMDSPLSSLGSPQSTSSPEPPAIRQGRSHHRTSRRLSLDSLSTEGSSVAALGESPRKMSASSSEHSIPRRISDPTHHVPREQRRNVEQNKKASETLLALKKQPRSKVHLTKPANPPPPPPTHAIPASASRSSTPPPPPPIPAPPPPRTEQPHPRGKSRPAPPPRQGSTITTRPAKTHPLQDQPGTSQTLGGGKRAARSSGHSNTNGVAEHVYEKEVDAVKRVQFPLVNLNDEFPEGIELISVRKTKPNLGIAVEGGAGTRQPIPKIISVQYGGSAYHNSNLKVGHVIIKVNGRSLRGMNHQQATRCIAEAFKTKANDGINFMVIDSNRYSIQY